MNKTIVWIISIVILAGAIYGLMVIAPKNKQAPEGTKPNVGDQAPDFSLPATNGDEVTLSWFRDKKNVLLYFNEGLTCQPCIEQIPELEKSLDEFEKLNTVLLSIMFDSVDQLKQTSELSNTKTTILSYNSAQTEVDYNLLPFSMGMGRRAGHTFILVGKDGKILWRKDYWPGRGHMVQGGTMFVPGSEILAHVKEAISQ